MQTDRVRLLAVGDVHSHRTDRRAQADAGAIAVNRFQIPGLIRGVAGVDECRDAPEIADARSKAVEFVPAHGRIAAGAEEQLDRYVARLARGDGAALELEYDLCLGVDRQPCRELQDAAAHRGGRDTGRRSADALVDRVAAVR